jgi:hypothetical protein
MDLLGAKRHHRRVHRMIFTTILFYQTRKEIIDQFVARMDIYVGSIRVTDDPFLISRILFGWQFIYEKYKLSPEFIEEFADRLLPVIQREYSRIINE